MHDPIGQTLRAHARLIGRYAIFTGSRECGGERWEIAPEGDGLVIEGEQELRAPHPLPSRHRYRLTLDSTGRPAGLDIVWSVAGRTLEATHRATGATWRVRIEMAGQVREQQGDFPSFCEIEFPSALFPLAILTRRDFQVGGEHEFPVLRIGPPLMAVTPERMMFRCVERGSYAAPWGEVPARRYVLTLPPRGEDEGWTFWAGEDDLLLESFEGPEPTGTWMKLVELIRP